MILTLCILLILLSEKTRAMGNTINKRHQINTILFFGFSPGLNFL